MTAVTVKANLDRSCNWRCCCCVDIEESKPVPLVRSPEMQDLAQRASDATKDVIQGTKSGSGELDVEFDAVHVHVKHTPETTPREEK